MNTTESSKTVFALMDDVTKYLMGDHNLERDQAYPIAATVSTLASDFVKSRADLQQNYLDLAATATREANAIANGGVSSNWINSTANAIAELHGRVRMADQALHMNVWMLESTFELKSRGGIDVFEYLNA